MRIKATSVIIICLIAVSMLGMPQTKGDSWWNYDWQYRMAVTVDNASNPNTLIDYQVKITLGAGFNYAKAMDNGEDIRFIDDHGNELNYWIEKWNDGGESILWVKVPTINGSSTETLFLYYGNPTALSMSSGPNTFEFFDDFDSYSGWSGDTAEFAATLLNNENVLYTDGASGYPGWIYKSIPSLDSYAVQIKIRDEQENNNQPHPGAVISGTDGDNWNSIYFRAGSNQIVGSITTGGTNHFGTPLHSYNIARATWYDIEAIVHNGLLQHLYMAGTELTNFSAWDIYDELSIVGLQHYGGSDGPGYYDKLRVRKYTDPEPQASLGTEEGVTTLSIKKTADKETAVPGNNLTYRITVTNNGPTPASNVIVTESYDSGFLFTGATPSPDPSTNDRWTFTAIAAGESATIQISGEVDAEEGGLTNVASFSSDNGGSGIATEETAITPLRSVVQRLWKVNILAIESSGTFAVENGLKTGRLYLERGENEISIDVYNTGILPAYNVQLEIIGLPWAQIDVTPHSADISPHSVQTYAVSLTIPESAPTGVHAVQIRTTGNFIHDIIEIEIFID